MIDIELKNGQSGYEAVGEYIRRYWDHNTIDDTVIVSIGTSRDGKLYDICNEVAYPHDAGVEFLCDWWEGERFIMIFGIKSIDEIDTSGGLYE